MSESTNTTAVSSDDWRTQLDEINERIKNSRQQEQEINEVLHPAVGKSSSVNAENIKAYRDQYAVDVEIHGKQGIKTGFDFLDGKFLLYPGITLIGGMPGIGKTSFTLQLANNLAEDKRKVLFISLEQSVRALVSKSLSAYLRKHEKKVPWPKLDRNQLSNTEKIECSRLMEEYYDTVGEYLTIWHYNVATPKQIEEAIREVQGDDAIPPIVMVDYLQKLRPSPVFDGEQQRVITSPRERIEAALGEIGGIQRTHDCIFIGICSLSRAGYNAESNGKPTLANLKETGQLEYDADRVLLLYKTGNQIMLDAQKDKEGSTWKESLTLEGDYNYFSRHGVGVSR